MKNRNVVIGLLVGTAAGLTIAVLRDEKTRNKLAKACTSIADTFLYGMYRLNDLKDKMLAGEEQEGERSEAITYKTHGQVNEEKSVTA